jgi:hypothetical protein
MTKRTNRIDIICVDCGKNGLKEDHSDDIEMIEHRTGSSMSDEDIEHLNNLCHGCSGDVSWLYW